MCMHQNTITLECLVQAYTTRTPIQYFIYTASQNKTSQHENHDISEVREFFCTKFCSFVQKKTVQKCAALCCIYTTYAKSTATQTSATNFAPVQKVDFIIKVIECLIPPLL